MKRSFGFVVHYALDSHLVLRHGLIKSLTDKIAISPPFHTAHFTFLRSGGNTNSQQQEKCNSRQ